MWTTIALLTALAAAPAASDLSLTHVRSTHGMLGPQRKSEAIAPGDILFLCFDIEGITVEEGGKVRYSLDIETSDATGKVVFRQKPTDNEATVSLGGNTVPAYARLTIGLDTPAGEYGIKVTVKDRASGQQQSLKQSIKVLPRDFALVRETISLDTEGEYPSAVFTSGQGAWVHCSAVEFGRAPGNKQPDLVFEVRIFDDVGKPTLAKPIVHKINKDIPANEKHVPLAFPLSLNRAGKFRLEVTATDQLNGKKAKFVLPFTVLSAAKE
jgi:hypothetical protein